MNYVKNTAANDSLIEFLFYKIYINNLINDIKNGKYDYIIFNYNDKTKFNDYIIKEKDIIFHLTSSYNQKNGINNNLTTIILEAECENILKEKYYLDKNDILLIFKYEYFIKGLKIPFIGYDIYHPYTKELLNLEYCDNTKIILNIPVYVEEKDLYKYNPNSDYYKDICLPIDNEKGFDLTIYDRKNEYNNKNMSLCPNNCEYSYYNNIIQKVSCDCVPQKTSSALLLDDIINKNKLLNNFIDFKSTSNIAIMKCIKQTFSEKGLKKNIGSYIILMILLSFVLCCILFYIKEYNIFFDKIKEIISQKTETNCFQNTDNNDNNVGKIYKNKTVTKKIEINNLNSKSSSSGFELKNELKNKNINDIIEENLKENVKISTINDSEINSFSYEEALQNDKRTFFEYYFSLIKTKHLLFFSFFPNNDYNSKIIKICLFLFSLALFYCINALFFTDETMHKIYEDEGIFNFIYSVPQIIYSSLISGIINPLIRFLSLTEKEILKIKKEKNYEKAKEKLSNSEKNIKIKFIIFFILGFIFLIAFWYYLASFCSIYKNTQLYLLKDTLISFSFSMIYPFIIYFIPCFLRISILKHPACFYKLSKIIQLL